MDVNLKELRGLVRSYALHEIGLPQLLEKLWPILLDAEGELVESIGDLLALHAAR
jgi:hypothetical protein